MCDDIIIEDRGIILGIVYYILKKYDSLKKRNIIITEKRIRKIIKYLFPELSFHTKRPNSFVINIRNQVHSDLVINNINNIPAIHTKRLYYLLWSSRDNPMVMYKHDNKHTKYHEKILSKFHGIYDNCNSLSWNTEKDNAILTSYLHSHDTMDLNGLSNFISCYVNNGMNCEKKVVTMPYFIEYPVYKDRTVYKDRVVYDKKAGEHTKKLLSSLTSKLAVLNNYMVE